MDEARLKEIEDSWSADQDAREMIQELIDALRDAWRERDEFVKDCNDALDRLGVPIENEGVSGQISVWRRIERIGGLQRELKSLIMWGGQIHDALDGRPLPFLPDEAAARIVVLRERAARAEMEINQWEQASGECAKLERVRDAAEAARLNGYDVPGELSRLSRALDAAKDPAR